MSNIPRLLFMDNAARRRYRWKRCAAFLTLMALGAVALILVAGIFVTAGIFIGDLLHETF